MHETARTNDPHIDLAIEEIVGLLPLPVQEDAQSALYAEWNEEFPEAISFADRVLARDPGALPMRMLRMRCLFAAGRLSEAEDLARDLIREDDRETEPHIYMGLICHAGGRFQDAVREFASVYPLEDYVPYYLSAYGDCLEKVGRRNRARDMFAEDVLHYIESGHIPSVTMLMGSFQHLLDLDAGLQTGLFAEDAEVFLKFLSEIEMDEAARRYLSSTIVLLSRHLDRPGFRMDFLDLVSRIDRAEYLGDKEGQEVIRSAYAALESYLYHEDPRVSALMEGCLSSIGAASYTESREEEKLSGAYSGYHLASYYGDHQEEIAYIRENYPISYEVLLPLILRIETEGAGEVREAMVREAQLHMPRAMDRPALRKAMEGAYQRLLTSRKKPRYLTGGKDTLVRSDKKIMPNDPCPCGSGKKYKHCHGRR